MTAADWAMGHNAFLLYQAYLTVNSITASPQTCQALTDQSAGASDVLMSCFMAKTRQAHAASNCTWGLFTTGISTRVTRRRRRIIVEEDWYVHAGIDDETAYKSLLGDLVSIVGETEVSYQCSPWHSVAASPVRCNSLLHLGYQLGTPPG